MLTDQTILVYINWPLIEGLESPQKIIFRALRLYRNYYPGSFDFEPLIKLLLFNELNYYRKPVFFIEKGIGLYCNFKHLFFKLLKHLALPARWPWRLA